MDFDPEVISYETLLKVFFSAHDPTAPPYSRQYASAVFYHDENQRRAAQAALEQAGKTRKKDVATELLPYTGFTRAEDYHQKFDLRIQKALYRQYQTYYPDMARFTDSTAVARVNGYLAGFGTMDQFEREAPGLGLSPAQIEAVRKQVGTALN